MDSAYLEPWGGNKAGKTPPFLLWLKGPSSPDESKVGYRSILCCKLPLGPIHQKKKKGKEIGKEREKREAYVRLSLVFHPSETVGKEQRLGAHLSHCPVQGSARFQQRETPGCGNKWGNANKRAHCWVNITPTPVLGGRQVEGLILGEAVSHRNGIFPWKGKRGRNQGFDTWQESTECKGLCALLSQAGSSRDGTSQGKPGQMGHSCTSQLQNAAHCKVPITTKPFKWMHRASVRTRARFWGCRGNWVMPRKDARKTKKVQWFKADLWGLV